MEAKQKETVAKGKDPKSNAYDWIESLVTAIVACILIFLFLFRVVNVQGSSMVPTLRESDKIVISRLAGNYKYGDIVVLTKTAFDDESMITVSNGSLTLGNITLDGDGNHHTATASRIKPSSPPGNSPISKHSAAKSTIGASIRQGASLAPSGSG